MRVKDLFDDIKNSRLTNLDKISSLEKVTDNFHPEKLKVLVKDLQTYINSTRRQAGINLEVILADCMYEAFIQSHKDNETLTSVTKDQFLLFLAKHGDELPVNMGQLKLAVEIAIGKHGDSYGNHLADFMELKLFEKMVADKIRDLENEQEETMDEPSKRGRKPTYDIADTERWLVELSQNRDYQHPDGSANLTAIDIELIIRHKRKTGQRPSETTIKNHRRQLGFMQK